MAREIEWVNCYLFILILYQKCWWCRITIFSLYAKSAASCLQYPNASQHFPYMPKVLHHASSITTHLNIFLICQKCCIMPPLPQRISTFSLYAKSADDASSTTILSMFYFRQLEQLPKLSEDEILNQMWTLEQQLNYWAYNK